MNNAASTPDHRPATVEPAQESIDMTTRLGNASNELGARVNDGSQLSTAVTAFVLMAASCLMMVEPVKEYKQKTYFAHYVLIPACSAGRLQGTLAFSARGGLFSAKLPAINSDN
jgi:hypothetical protein